ncbi:LptF/LptG family permease [Marinilongibacter aquaticus]|uniref:LptF/LptG family permease n=1 Tax=Marinilongibacter aquaticus TaxID=2975157 RepID=UPI0021BDB262|nr:LptF/LptG family permease [Marinilongibacter aquaticus]UBM59553.1 LptF/LptG family permease [Marinilongibacter aquaticus]
MKKIDKLVIKTFLGPFVLTTAVVVFIFLLRFLMIYFDEFVGKDLGYLTFAQLFGYFSLITVPVSLPLSTLLASLMSFGNLGEHTELTAMKSAGIPLGRIVMPTLVLTVLISMFSFWFNNTVTPWANLKGYSMLWDVRTTKVALNIDEGIFYRELPGYSIKVKKKFQDNETLKDIIIYDHSQRNGNRNVTVADSGKMYAIYDNNYLVFELFNGHNYSENRQSGSLNDTPMFRNSFKKNRLVFSLSSFGMKRTNENQFKYHEYMKNISELNVQVDSIGKEVTKQAKVQLTSLKSIHTYQFKKLPPKFEVDSLSGDSTEVIIAKGPWVDEKIKAYDEKEDKRASEVWSMAKSNISSLKSQAKSSAIILGSKQRNMYSADLELWHKFSYAVACLAMFVIGASLGSIIKKGGFGLPVLIAISFFIFYYVMMQLTDKNAKEGFIPVLVAVWIPDFVLLCIGAVLLKRATQDQGVFDNAHLLRFWDWLKSLFPRNKKIMDVTN